MRKRHKTKYPGIYYRLVDEERPDGPRRYIVWWEDANGDTHTETLPVGATLDDATVRQSKLKTKKSQGDLVVPTKLTVGEVVDLWLEARKSRVKEKTLETDQWGIQKVKKYLGRRRISELSADDVAGMIALMKKDGKKTNSVEKALTPLRGAIKLAMRRGWISTNPVSLLFSHERPKRDQRVPNLLARDDIPKLLEAAASEQWRTLFALLVFTGLRISEALALRWEDIDDVVRVRESKTPAGVRSVMLMPALKRQLMIWRLSQAPGAERVFPVAYKTAQKALYRAEKKAGLERVTLHELRHTFASILIGQHELPTFVARQMGHASPAETMKTYAHLWEEQESAELALSRLEEQFGQVMGK